MNPITPLPNKTPGETDWLPRHKKPLQTRLGVYKRYHHLRYDNPVCYSFWDGQNFSVCKSTPEEALAHKGVVSNYQKLPWCGKDHE